MSSGGHVCDLVITAHISSHDASQQGITCSFYYVTANNIKL